MTNQGVQLVLVQLAQRLHRQVRRYRSGKLSDAQFARKFEALLQNQYAWLAEHGVPQAQAAVAVHGAVLVLTSPGLRPEAEEEGLPLQVREFRALCAAAADIAKNHDVKESRVLRQLSSIVAHYTD